MFSPFELLDSGDQVSDIVLRVDDTLREVFGSAESEDAGDSPGLGGYVYFLEVDDFSLCRLHVLLSLF
jgi:hypothetical protein